MLNIIKENVIAYNTLVVIFAVIIAAIIVIVVMGLGAFLGDLDLKYGNSFTSQQYREIKNWNDNYCKKHKKHIHYKEIGK